MKNSRGYTTIIITLLFGLLVSSCKDGGNSTPNPEITSITPTTGPVGTVINIRGSGFGSNASAIEVSFSGTATETVSVSNSGIQTTGSSASKIEVNISDIPAEITSVSDTLIETSVPEGASSGAIRVSVGGVTAQGPAFMVDPLLPGIQSIQPDSGPVSTSVSINGTGFGNDTSDVEVRFNGITAENSFLSDTLIQTNVPEGATSGAVQVVVGGVGIDGPVFTVEPTMPGIQSIRPDSGEVGSVVTITGMNFGSTPAENSVTFNGTAAPVDSANASRIKTKVPQGATSGPVEVTVDGVTATGSNFKVLTNTGTLRVLIRTTGEDRDPDGYTVSVDGDEVGTGVSDSLLVSNLEIGNHSVELAGVASNCSVSGANPRDVSITARTTTSTRFTIECRGALSIQSVSPDSGLVGSVVTIRGSGFSSNTAENVVRFNGTEARVDSASANRIKTTVPEGAISGPVEVTVDGTTATGSNFKVLGVTGTLAVQINTTGDAPDSDGYTVRVDGGVIRTGVRDTLTVRDLSLGTHSVRLSGVASNCSVSDANPRDVSITARTTTSTTFEVRCVIGMPSIQSIRPDSGEVGSVVTITGMNFGSTPAENSVTFNGTAAPVDSANASRIKTRVPEGATSGPVEVTVAGATATGPDFKVLNTTEYPGTISTFTTISAGRDHSCGIAASGDAYCWGNNEFGQLGNGEVGVGLQKNLPFKINMPAGVSFTVISVGFRHTIAITSSGEAYAWGLNTFGQLGDGTTTDRLAPVKVQMPSGVSFTGISSGVLHSVAITADGQAYAWGRNNVGQLGNGSTTNSSTPAAVSMPDGVIFTAIDAGDRYNLALSPTGQAYAWGANFFGRLGDGTTTNRQTPVPVIMPVGVSFTRVSASSGRISMALSGGGQAYGWGLNNFGQLGDGTTTDQDHPVAVEMPAGVGFADIDTGENHTIAITSSGTAYAWGGNGSGELGNGGFLRQSMPMPVAGGTGFTEINAGQNHNIALGTNGQGFGWGENLDGELGDGTFVRRTSVVKVGGN